MHGKVTVMGSVSQKKVLRAARRSGRLAVLWPSAYSNPAHHHSYAQPPPAAAYYPNHYQAKAVQALAQPQQHYYFSSVPRGSKNGGVSTVARTPVAQYPQQGKASSYNGTGTTTRSSTGTTTSSTPSCRPAWGITSAMRTRLVLARSCDRSLGPFEWILCRPRSVVSVLVTGCMLLLVGSCTWGTVNFVEEEDAWQCKFQEIYSCQPIEISLIHRSPKSLLKNEWDLGI
jgi:hypothetical protein